MDVARAWSGRVLLVAALVVPALWLVPARTSALSAASPQTVTVTITGIAFAVDDVTVHVGDTVKWVNKDTVDHTATEKQNLWRVEIKAGKTGSVVMKKAGTFEYYCEYHPNMTAHVVVKPVE